MVALPSAGVQRHSVYVYGDSAMCTVVYGACHVYDLWRLCKVSSCVRWVCDVWRPRVTALLGVQCFAALSCGSVKCMVV